MFGDSLMLDRSFHSLPSAPLPQILVGLPQSAWFFVSLMPQGWSTEPNFSTAAKGCGYRSSVAPFHSEASPSLRLSCASLVERGFCGSL